MLKYILPLSVILTAPAAWAVDWEFIQKDNYMALTNGDDRFYLGCYPSGISMEYVNAKEMKCSAQTQTCTTDVDYDAQRTQPITLATDDGNLSLTRSGAVGPTVPLGFVDMATYKGEEDQEALGAFARTKKLELVFPAISRTVTFDNIQNGNTLVTFFQTCIKEAIAFEKEQADLRHKMEQAEPAQEPKQ